MGQIKGSQPVLPILVAFSRYDAALDWARQKAIDAWGSIVLESERFAFDQTDYYATTMGAGLRKMFLAMEPLLDPAHLPARKVATNQWETEYAQRQDHPEPRPLNLDPGYLNQAKFILASTKDHSHRIYLSDGIYAEITLSYRSGGWQSLPWTYPDYRREEYHAFLTRCRDYLRARKQ